MEQGRDGIGFKNGLEGRNRVRVGVRVRGVFFVSSFLQPVRDFSGCWGNIPDIKWLSSASQNTFYAPIKL